MLLLLASDNESDLKNTKNRITIKNKTGDDI